jgi:hypothetical protein
VLHFSSFSPYCHNDNTHHAVLLYYVALRRVSTLLVDDDSSAFLDCPARVSAAVAHTVLSSNVRPEAGRVNFGWTVLLLLLLLLRGACSSHVGLRTSRVIQKQIPRLDLTGINCIIGVPFPSHPVTYKNNLNDHLPLPPSNPKNPNCHLPLSPSIPTPSPKKTNNIIN